ncbi:hypothetical protein PMAYCL1PPCAC_29233, partial [Pristionchus mayeri]
DLEMKCFLFVFFVLLVSLLSISTQDTVYSLEDIVLGPRLRRNALFFSKLHRKSRWAPEENELMGVKRYVIAPIIGHSLFLFYSPAEYKCCLPRTPPFHFALFS